MDIQKEQYNSIKKTFTSVEEKFYIKMFIHDGQTDCIVIGKNLKIIYEKTLDKYIYYNYTYVNMYMKKDYKKSSKLISVLGLC